MWKYISISCLHLVDILKFVFFVLFGKLYLPAKSSVKWSSGYFFFKVCVYWKLIMDRLKKSIFLNWYLFSVCVTLFQDSFSVSPPS